MAFPRPLVSIVIPVYNGANYLGAAIESACEQTYGNIEILVVDDGSNDDGATAGIAARYGDRIRYLYQENAGVSAALNRGIAAMNGEFFSWLSHDDLYYADKLSQQVEFLARRPDVRVVASGLDVIDNLGDVRSTYRPESLTEIHSGRAVMDHWIYGCSMLIHRDLFAEVGSFNERNRTIQDLELWLKMVALGHPIFLLPAVLCAWRRHEESDSFRRRKAHFVDVEQLFSSLLSIYRLEFFAGTPPPLSAGQRAATLEWLGEQACHRGAAGAGRRFFMKAALANPMPFRRPFWRLLRKIAAGFWWLHR